MRHAKSERLHHSDGDMEIFVLLMVTHRAENGEWVVNCCLNSAVKGLQLVDLSSMSLGDTSKHSLSMRLPSTLSVVLFGQEDRKLGSSGARIGTTSIASW
jgi:hypothetical protein